MEFEISEKIFEKYPDLKIGVVIAKNIGNIGKESEIVKLLREIESEIRNNFVSHELSQDERIAAWREVYRSFGAKPSKHKSSIEALMKRILKDKNIPDINKIVNLYNYISLKHIVPVGGEDLDKVEGDIVLNLATGNESFVALGSQEVKHPRESEVVYCDDNDVLCRRWNWRESEKTKLTEQTKNVLLCIEAIPPTSKEKLKEVVGELAGLVEKFCGGETTTEILTKENRICSI